MSHTFQSGQTTFIFDGDFKGDVVIEHGSCGLTLPVGDLLQFVAQYVRSRKITALEDAKTLDQILDL